MTAQTSNYQLGNTPGSRYDFYKNGSKLFKVYTITFELDINISHKAGGIVFHVVCIQGWKRNEKSFSEIYQELRRRGWSKETAIKSLAKLEGCKNGQVVGWVSATRSRASHKLMWLASPMQEELCMLSCSVMSILCSTMDCSPPGSSVHGILQARTLEWVAISFSRGSS